MIENDEAAQLATIVLELRKRRYEHLPESMFGEHAWGILLAMFIADAEGSRATAYDIFEAAGCSASSGKRWMAALMFDQLVVSEGPCDGSNMVSLTPGGIHAVEKCMQDAQALMAVRDTGINGGAQ